MSHIVVNPSHKLNESEDYRLVVESGGVVCDCEVASASFRFEKGSVNNIFQAVPKISGSITTDYDFYERQMLDFYYESDSVKNSIGQFVVVNVGETGADKKTYTLENQTWNNLRKNIDYMTEFGYRRAFDRFGFDYHDHAVKSSGLMNVWGLAYGEATKDFWVIYDENYNKFSSYKYEDASMLYNATLVDTDFSKIRTPAYDITRDNIKGQSESSTGFVKTGIDYYGITFSYVKFDTKKQSEYKSGTISWEEYEQEMYATETATLYLYRDGSGIIATDEKPNGNGIVVEYPFIVGALNNDDHYTMFKKYIMSSKVFNMLISLENVDLTPRSISIPFHPDYFDNTSNVVSYDVYGADFFTEYGDTDEEIEMTDEQYNAFKNTFMYRMPVFVTTLNYNGAFTLELSTGEQFEGSSSVTSSESSSINISTSSSGSVSVDSLMANISNLQKTIAEMQYNFVNKETFANELAGLLDISKINGSVLEDLTIKGSAFEDGTIDGSKLVDSIFKDGKIQGSAIDTSTFTNGSITGSMIDNSTITDSILENVDIDANKIKTGTLDADKITIKNINGSEIKDGSILAKALSNEAVTTLSGTNVYYQAEMPTAKKVGDVWYHTVVDVEEQKQWSENVSVWDGERWVVTPLDATMLLAGSITAREINVNSLVGNSAFLNALNANVIKVESAPFYNVTEKPTLENYPANTFVKYRKYVDRIDFKHKFADLNFPQYLGAKAYDDKGNSWIFTTDEKGNYVWKDNSSSIDNELKSLTKKVNGVTVIDGGRIDTDSLFAQDITATGTIEGATLTGATISSTNFDIGGVALTETDINSFTTTELEYNQYTKKIDKSTTRWSSDESNQFKQLGLDSQSFLFNVSGIVATFNRIQSTSIFATQVWGANCSISNNIYAGGYIYEKNSSGDVVKLEDKYVTRAELQAKGVL